MIEEKEPQNRFDQALENFVQKYQKEIAGFLIGVFLVGIFSLSFLVWSRKKEPIEIERGGGEKDVIISPLPTSISSIIVVDISGAVNSPGVYEIPEGSRVKDLIDKAGGFVDDADMDYIDKNLNQAQTLSDGEKIYIPQKTGASSNSGGSGQTLNPNSSSQGQVAGSEILGKININTASQSQLETLSGIGPVYARKIIEGRPYKTIEEIQKVSGIGPKTFEKIKDKITVS